jgi:hypothetical protein
VSDGITEARRAEERYFDAMRERLTAEDLLYGIYDPAKCPNLQDVGDPFCVPLGELFGECGLMWCQPCHAFLGPWGAWRCLGTWAVNDEYSVGSWCAFLLWERLRAVGWSP